MSNKRGKCRIMSGHKMDTSQCLISYIIGHRKTVTGGVVYVEKGRKVSKSAGISSIPTRLIPHLFHTTSPSNLSLSSSSHSHHSALRSRFTSSPCTLWPLQKTSKHYCHQQFDHFESQKISNLYRRTQENIHLQNHTVSHWIFYQFSRKYRIVQR